MKLFIYAHEGNQLCWIAFMEKGATNEQHVPCNSFAIAMAQQVLGTLLAPMHKCYIVHNHFTLFLVYHIFLQRQQTSTISTQKLLTNCTFSSWG